MQKYSKEEVQIAVSNADCYAQVFRNLGLGVNGGSYKWLKNLIKENEIDTTHFLSRKELAIRSLTFQDKEKKQQQYTNNDISTDKRLSSSTIRKFMIVKGFVEKCNICELTEWQGSLLRLDIDHMDGNPLNNKLENLQFICPNCHRQKTILYKEFNIRHKKEKIVKFVTTRETVKNYCLDCNKPIKLHSLRCKPCNAKLKEGVSKIEWPSDDDLKRLVWEIPASILCKQLGVSDVAIAKRCKKRGIEKPSLGYWRKLETNTL